MKFNSKLSPVLTVMTVILAATVSSSLAYAKKEKKMTKQSASQTTIPEAPAPTTAPAEAGPITYQINTLASEEKFEDTNIDKSRTLVAGDKQTELKLVNYGLRKKAVFGLVPVRVYVAQFFAAQPEKLTRTEDGILASLKNAGPVQLRLTFLRDLPGPKIADSFKEGLEANKINPKTMSVELQQVMNVISAINEFKKGESFSITGVWTDKSSSILLESSTEIKVITGAPEFADHIFSIWFAKPADGKLGELKKTLIK